MKPIPIRKDPQTVPRSNPVATERLVRVWFATYIVLWIAEGALRKWIAPGLNAPLYFARDLLTCGVLLLVLSKGVSRDRIVGLAGATTLALLIVVLGSLQTISGSVAPKIVLIGLDAYAVPLLALGLVSVSERRSLLATDASRIVRGALPVQGVLAVLQVTAPLTSFINRAGNDGSTGFTTSDGIVRASGSFSSPLGLTAFVTLAVSLLLAHLLTNGFRLRPFVSIQLISATIVVALGGSRGALLNTAVVVVGAVVWVIATRGFSISKTARTGAAVLAVLGAYTVLNRLLPSVLSAFSQRIRDAARVEDPIQRLVDGATSYWAQARQVRSWLGEGLGTHTSAAQSAGSTSGWIEIELSRWVAELGLPGLFLAVLRQFLTVALLILVARASARATSPAALLAFLGVSLSLFTGGITAPSSQQAFVVIGLALVFLAWPEDSGVGAKPSRTTSST